MEIRIYSDGNTYLAKSEDGTYAVGSKRTVERNLERLHAGDVKQLPCSRPAGTSSAWKYLTDGEPVATVNLLEGLQWLS